MTRQLRPIAHGDACGEKGLHREGGSSSSSGQQAPWAGRQQKPRSKASDVCYGRSAWDGKIGSPSVREHAGKQVMYVIGR